MMSVKKDSDLKIRKIKTLMNNIAFTVFDCDKFDFNSCMYLYTYIFIAYYLMP